MTQLSVCRMPGRGGEPGDEVIAKRPSGRAGTAEGRAGPLLAEGDKGGECGSAGLSIQFLGVPGSRGLCPSRSLLLRPSVLGGAAGGRERVGGGCRGSMSTTGRGFGLQGAPPEPCLEELGAKWPLPLCTEPKLVHLLE